MKSMTSSAPLRRLGQSNTGGLVLLTAITWLVYGVIKTDWPIVAANAVTLALAGVVLVMKLRFRGSS